MAYSHISRLVLIVVLVVVIGLMGSGPSPAQAQICRGLNFGTLLSKCGGYVKKSGPKIKPSDKCCDVVKGVDIVCACKYVTKAMENYVDPEKAMYVARSCGIPVKSGTKCGSYTVPRA